MNDLVQLFREREQLLWKIKHLVGMGRIRDIVPYNAKFASQEYLDLVQESTNKLNDVTSKIIEIRRAMHGPSHFSRENVWVWGGPTPSWGGSMAKDASIKAAKWFDFDNIMYVYGELNEEMMAIHKDCGKVICHLGSNCRTAGAKKLGDVEEAEELSRLSLQFPNIRGAVIDDMIGNCGRAYSKKIYYAMHEAIKKHNPNLEMYGVIYTHELDDNRCLELADSIDRVILWTWCREDLLDLEMNVAKCLNKFPGKKIMMGLFMFDYGRTILPNQVADIAYQLDLSRKFLSEGKIEDIVILGDREIDKCPAVADYIKSFFQAEFAKN